MSQPRRDTDRHSAEAVERMWHRYADQIGIPGAGPAGIGEEAARPRSRRLVVAVVAVVAIAVTVGIALWPGSPPLHVAADRRSPAPTSAPAGEADRVVPVAAPADDTAPRVQPPTPALTVAEPIVAPAPAVQRDLVAPEATSPARVTGTSLMFRISFDFGADDVDRESRRILDKVIVAMKANPDWRVAIEGHTDAHGAPDYNRALSERRAEAVRSYLQAAGVAPRRLSAAGFGAARPVAPNDAPGSALNRRVELHRR
jgi:outer membrane protein OmpA-like peptidoglycan-associated protein